MIGPGDSSLDVGALIEAAVEIADGFYRDEPIDWDDLLYRLETWCDVDLGSDMDSALVRKLQRAVRAARQEQR